jgi:signal transduction histidine kinase
MQTTAEMLRKFHFLEGLPDKVLEDIARFAQEENHHDGSVLFSEGNGAECLYLILEGKVSLEKLVQLGSTGTPRRATIEIISPWNPVGWSALVSPHVYTSTGVCTEKTRVLAIRGSNLLNYLQKQPEVGLELINRVATIIRERLTNSTSILTYFLTIVSHELKRPLAAVENYIQVLIGGFAGEISDKQKRLLERSSLRISDLRALISDLLDFARMQPDQIRADFELVNPQEIASESLEEVRLAATQKDIEVRASGAVEFKPIVVARRRLRQVLSNLLANAIKFSPEGSTVHLSARDDPDALWISVSDQGIGVPTDDQPHIFDEFFRASNAEQISGTGLGLSITKKIIDAHEGEITLESPYGDGISGCRFTLKIPRNLPLPSQIGTDRTSTEDATSEHTGETSPQATEREGT